MGPYRTCKLCPCQVCIVDEEQGIRNDGSKSRSHRAWNVCIHHCLARTTFKLVEEGIAHVIELSFIILDDV
jgi:hypothetical protein